MIQHAAGSSLGVLRAPLEGAGLRLRIELVDETWRVTPGMHSCRALVLLGGPQHAGDDAGNPQFPEILGLIRTLHERGLPILGICLGGQLLARALGGAVHKHCDGEFGFVELLGEGANDPVFPAPPPYLHIMQWHDDSFTPPPGTTILASTAGCRQQGFRLDNSIGLQCHPEVDAAILDGWCAIRVGQYGDAEGADRVKAEAVIHLQAAMDFGRQLGSLFAQTVRQAAS